jgi:hypothetical protein
MATNALTRPCEHRQRLGSAILKTSSSLEAPGAYEGGQLHLVGSIRTAVHVTNGFASTASTSSTDAIV